MLLECVPNIGTTYELEEFMNAYPSLTERVDPLVWSVLVLLD